jgi:hypothetical protein
MFAQSLAKAGSAVLKNLTWEATRSPLDSTVVVRINLRHNKQVFTVIRRLSEPAFLDANLLTTAVGNMLCQLSANRDSFVYQLECRDFAKVPYNESI